MSIYSQSIKTQIIDPSFFSQDRCEFRLNNLSHAFLPTLRIGNLGLANESSAGGPPDNTYHMGAGVACLISRIRLMDGNQELDSLRNVGQFMTFKGLLKTNSQNDNVYTNYSGGSLGFSTGAGGDIISVGNKTITSVGSPDTLGTLDLKECFGFLGAVSHLSTKVFKNLRVVIEFVPNSDAASLVNNITAANVDKLVKQVPILMADSIEDPVLVAAMDKQLVSAEWVSIEHDLSNIPKVPEITATTPVADAFVQRNSLRINGFQGKSVSRLLIAKNYEDKTLNTMTNTTSGQSNVKSLGGFGSKALHKERCNVRLNGKNLLGGEGLTTPNQTSMLLSDTWGDLNVGPFQDTESVGLDSKYSLTQIQPEATLIGYPPKNWVGINLTMPRVQMTGGLLDDTVPQAEQPVWVGASVPIAQQGSWIGNTSFIGIPIYDRVADLQIDLSRVGTNSDTGRGGAAAGAPTTSYGNFQALNLNVYGEVAKVLNLSGKDYKISYQ